jgi:L,D-transpeptidase ErfK/SrfK
MRWALSPQCRQAQCAVPRWYDWLLPVLLGFAALTAAPASAAEFALAPDQTVVGQLQSYIVKKGEVFEDIARRFDVGYTELVEANPGVDPWLAPPGTRITIPALYILPASGRRGIVLNLAQYRLFYFPPGGHEVFTYPVGLGVIGWKTPIGTTRIVRKEPHPAWIPPASIRAQHAAEGDILPAVVPPGPDNPLGAFALHLGWPRILIHGTNKPDGIGRNVSHGCIHLYPEDIAQLFSMVRLGTLVRTLNEPAIAGWAGDRLYLMVHPSPKQVEQIDITQPKTFDPARGVRELVQRVAGQYAGAIDWQAVDRAAAERTNMPVVVADISAYAARAQSAPPPPRASQAEPQRGPERDFGREVQNAYARALAQHQHALGAAAAPGPPIPLVGGAAARQPAADPPQYPYVDPAQSPALAEQSFDRAMQIFERAEHLDDGR